MKTHLLFALGAAVGLLSLMASVPRHAHMQGNRSIEQTLSEEAPVVIQDSVPPTVFQAAGPTAASIQSSVDQYRTAIGDPNNGIASGLPNGLPSGRREINWDGRDVVTPGPLFDGFLVTRGALFRTPDGNAFVQATPAGLANLFNNPTYETTFAAFSQPRLFSAIGGRITDVDFFVAGGGNIAATTKGFGAVFSDVDRADGSGPGEKHGNRHASTLIEYFGINGELLFSSFVPASPGNRSFSFFGIVFQDARIARVRITSGNVAPGPDDGGKRDVVMMDDFIYGEPQRIH